eukprot:Skav225159  [mRNA]  locus=scaffold1056:315768:318401:- [translate_table: standard]
MHIVCTSFVDPAATVFEAMKAFCGQAAASNGGSATGGGYEASSPAGLQLAHALALYVCGCEGPIIEEITDEVPEAPCAVANGASSSSAPSSAAVQGPVELRCLTAADAVEVSRVCSASEPLFDSSADLQAHLEAAGERIFGVALCGSDGVFGHLLQLSVEPGAEALVTDTKKRLIDRCEQACKERGLRGLQAALSKEDADLFKDSGFEFW